MTEKFTEQFPSLKDGDYATFDRIQKDLLMACCLDKEKVRQAIENALFDEGDWYIQCQKEKLLEELGL